MPIQVQKKEDRQQLQLCGYYVPEVDLKKLHGNIVQFLNAYQREILQGLSNLT